MNREVLPARRRLPLGTAACLAVAALLAAALTGHVAGVDDRHTATELQIQRLQHDVHWLGVRIDRIREERQPPWRYVSVGGGGRRTR